ncbi:MAG: NAD-dependent protein deacetylase [Longimicrobiales bacterium]|nr:NAD-dependent protein deacetylase [Longimicrobiales bacterium]
MTRKPTGSGVPGELLALLEGRRVVVLVGAGCSTESGIPDYRGPDGSLRTRQPMQYAEFVGSSEARTRYWARSAVGWRRVAEARPNEAHRALARLEEGGVLAGVITQNVDGLHQEAGSRRVVELHGTLAWVRCLECGHRVRREDHQRRLMQANPGWTDAVSDHAGSGSVAPDGDAEVIGEAVRSFSVPGCRVCGGILKPDVVFFGESVPARVVERAWALFAEGDVLLVVGSSLTVFSGRRFVYRAVERQTPVAVVNLGPTRADDVAAVKVEGRLGRLLPAVADELLGA